ncbi:MAG: protein-glutamate O-methyltransferase [bacterium]|nr:protein-glutamate O-methyltransferase [bacterium]
MKETPVFDIPRLSPEEFNSFRALIYRYTGISLNLQKIEMVRGRLSKRLRDLGLDSFQEYFEYLTGNALDSELPHLIDAISTNKTSFFREALHFEFLREVVFPALMSKKKNLHERRIRIWSAGCSTGEEPYSIAMEAARADLLSLPQWDTQILATDISEEVLCHARAATYQSEKLEDLPEGDIKRFFCNVEKGRYRVNDKLRNHVQFRRLNLHENTFPFQNPFDIIFCRNVMIYFDMPSKRTLLDKYYRHLLPGGYLFTGHSESLSSIQTNFRYVRPAVYQKPSPA